jgi:hypothetical protein
MILTTRKPVGPVEVLGTVKAFLSDGSSASEDETSLRFIYYSYEEEAENPNGQMWLPSFTFRTDEWFSQSIQNPAKAASIRFSFSFQLTFLPH